MKTDPLTATAAIFPALAGVGTVAIALLSPALTGTPAFIIAGLGATLLAAAAAIGALALHAQKQRRTADSIPERLLVALFATKRVLLFAGGGYAAAVATAVTAGVGAVAALAAVGLGIAWAQGAIMQVARSSPRPSRRAGA